MTNLLRAIPRVLPGLAFATMATLGTSVALPAQQAEVRVELSAKRVLSVDGRESLAAADKAKPGDVIQYEAIYRNTGQAAAKNVAATVPIPAGLALLPESSKPAAAQASVDGKDFRPTPLTREVKNSAGVTETQVVPLAEYRALRWTVEELPPGGNTTVTLRARVLTNGGTP